MTGLGNILHRAGGLASGEFVCAGCHYGIVIAVQLPSCPMCGGQLWEPFNARFRVAELASGDVVATLERMPGSTNMQ